jgi:hypothetical protein
MQPKGGTVAVLACQLTLGSTLSDGRCWRQQRWSIRHSPQMLLSSAPFSSHLP